jgi:hypothetical protein
MEHMERNIMAPILDLQNRIRYRVDVLKDTYESQLELLDGGVKGDMPAASSSSFPRSSSNPPVGSGASGEPGLKAKMGELNVGNEELKVRMKAIVERTLSQQHRMTQVHMIITIILYLIPDLT